MGVGEAIDRLISVPFPVWGAKRSHARMIANLYRERHRLASTFAAAEHSRLTFDWTNRNTSADGALLGDMDVMNARARAAARDDWAAAAIVSGYRRHVVGSGIFCRSNARDPETGEPLRDFNKAANRIWDQWCRAKWCDIERRKSFYDFQSMMVSEKVQVGEAFVAIRLVQGRRGIPGVVLQALEPEMLDRSIYRNPDNGNEIRNGVEIDKYAAPVAYWFYTEEHPLDAFGLNRKQYTSERIPAEFVCHYARWDRPRQTHGVSRLAPVLKKLRHLQMYDEYQLVAARMEACYGAAIQGSALIGPGSLGASPAAGDDTQNANGSPMMEFEPGMIHRLAPGETINWHDPKRPGDLYDPFVRAQVNQISTGSGLDYVTVVRDFTGGTYSGQRQGMIERDYEITPEQWELVDVFCIPAREAVIDAAIRQGLLKADRYMDDPNWKQAYLEADWRPQAKPWIDPANQASAAETALRNKLTTRMAILNELGEDWRETFQQLAEEERELKRMGLSSGDAAEAGTPGEGGNDG